MRAQCPFYPSSPSSARALFLPFPAPSSLLDLSFVFRTTDDHDTLVDRLWILLKFTHYVLSRFLHFFVYVAMFV